MTRQSQTTTWRKLGLRTRGETERQDARHQWRRDNQDQHSAHETQHLTSECARSLLVSYVQSCVVIFTHCTPHRGSSCARVSSHPCMKWASLFDFELSIPSNFLFFSFSFNLPQSLLLFFHFYEGSSNTAYSAKKEMGSTDESYLRIDLMWVSTSLLAQSSLSICHCQVLCVLWLCALIGKMRDNLVVRWKKQIQWYSENNWLL